ncbi:unnamed protein product, partial [Polarella glacialis]
MAAELLRGVPDGGSFGEYQVIAAALDKRIVGCQESLYFILRSLGLPAVGAPGTIPRVEIEKLRNPSLWAALQRLGVPHGGHLMIVEAEEPLPRREVQADGALRRTRSAPPSQVPRLQLGDVDPSAPWAPASAPKNQRPTSAAEQRLRCEHLTRPSRRRVAVTGGYYGGYGSRPLFKHCFAKPCRGLPRAASLPRISKAEAEDLVKRLAVPRWPQDEEPPELYVMQPYIPVRTAEPEAQRQRCAELARPKARPRRPASATRPKSKAEAAEQQSHCSRLARPKGVAMPPSGPASLANFSLGFARSASSSALVAGQTSGRGDAG